LNSIRTYFPDLSDRQLQQFEALLPLYEEWNAQINVVSRKDMEHFYEHHVLHSLAIAKVVQFADGTRILDIGTGGGFPGVPLAIMFPECSFLLVDSIGKKIKVASDVIQRIGLTNATAVQQRAEDVSGKFDYVVSRAVTSLDKLAPWCRKLFAKGLYDGPLPRGIICLKGGDLAEELAPFGRRVRIWDISAYFKEEFFETKRIVHLTM